MARSTRAAQRVPAGKARRKRGGSVQPDGSERGAVDAVCGRPDGARLSDDVAPAGAEFARELIESIAGAGLLTAAQAEAANEAARYYSYLRAHCGASHENAASSAVEYLNDIMLRLSAKPALADARKHDDDKPPISLVPYEAVEQIAHVMAFGARKYDTHNWRKGMAWSRCLDAAMRHLGAWSTGEDFDQESGLSHLAHAGCCIMFLLTYEATCTGTDDRWHSGLAAAA